MKKRMLFYLILAGITCLIFTFIPKSEAQDPIFFADFDAKGTPNNTVNDSGSWKPEHPTITWAIGNFPANGTQALQMTAGGCGNSGFTPFPTVDNWSNGIIQVDLGWNDDDSWGIMFRRNSQTEGYFVFLGFTETLSLALFDLGILGLSNGQCLSDTGVEVGAEPGTEITEDKPIKTTLHNLAPLDQTANTSYTARIVAQGSTIKVWYGLTEDFPDNPLKDPNPNDVSSYIEAEDSTYTSGNVGIWHESNDNGVIDNVYVFDRAGLAVSPQENAATMWGSLKK
jgi:hypothetical protein